MDQFCLVSRVLLTSSEQFHLEEEILLFLRGEPASDTEGADKIFWVWIDIGNSEFFSWVGFPSKKYRVYKGSQYDQSSEYGDKWSSKKENIDQESLFHMEHGILSSSIHHKRDEK